jgi:two-component system, cell cycle sensor histidine kinase and response regulator CckA
VSSIGKEGMKTILLIEDYPARLIAFAMILRSCGYAVLEAYNRDEAIHTCLEHSGPIQLLLMDLELSGNGGPLLAERLLALSPEMQVLFMFSSPLDILFDAGPLPSGCTFLSKPFVPTALASAVRELLERPRLTLRLAAALRSA